ncbi:MAG: HDIG domain-containing protein [Candidatus Woesearchaeota archaeon]
MFSRKKPISDIQEGDNVDDIFVVKVKKGVQKYQNGYSISLLLTDEHGDNIDFRFWGPDDEARVSNLYKAIKPDSVVHVKGRASSYMGKLQLTTNEPIEILADDQYNPDEFIKPPKKDIGKMKEGLDSTIDYVGNEQIKQLLRNIFNDEETGRKFINHPGAISIHHNWRGGLLQHTIEVLNYCILSHKQFPDLDKDLLIAGALLHDIGKMEELEVSTRIKASEKGQLVGHIALGTAFVEKKIDEIHGFDPVLKNKILHMMVSHHGLNDHGSPKEPMFAEAVALHYADQASAKVAEMTEYIAESRKHTEDSFMFSRRNQRNIFLK